MHSVGHKFQNFFKICSCAIELLIRETYCSDHSAFTQKLSCYIIYKSSGKVYKNPRHTREAKIYSENI